MGTSKELDKRAFEAMEVAEGDGKALVCCVGRAELEILKPRLDEVFEVIPKDKMVEFLPRVACDGDGKAVVCCIGNKLAVE